MARKLQLIKKSVGILIPNECSFLTRAQDKFLREVQFQHHPLLPNSEKHELQCLRCCCYLPIYCIYYLDTKLRISNRLFSCQPIQTQLARILVLRHGKKWWSLWGMSRQSKTTTSVLCKRKLRVLCTLSSVRFETTAISWGWSSI